MSTHIHSETTFFCVCSMGEREGCLCVFMHICKKSTTLNSVINVAADEQMVCFWNCVLRHNWMPCTFRVRAMDVEQQPTLAFLPMFPCYLQTWTTCTLAWWSHHHILYHFAFPFKSVCKTHLDMIFDYKKGMCDFFVPILIDLMSQRPQQNNIICEHLDVDSHWEMNRSFTFCWPTNQLDLLPLRTLWLYNNVTLLCPLFPMDSTHNYFSR